MPALTELEKRLAGPQSDQVRQDVLERLLDFERRLRREAARQLPRDEYQQVAGLLEAAVAAQQVLRRWASQGDRQDLRFSQLL